FCLWFFIVEFCIFFSMSDDSLYRRIFSLAIFILFLIVFPDLTLVAQDHDSAREQTYEVKEVEFEGNKTFDDGLLAGLLQNKESPGWFPKFLYKKISRKLGSPPELYNPAVLQVDLARLRQFYWDNGFVNARVTTSAALDTSSRSIKLTFLIEENRRSLIDSVGYIGIENVADDVRSKIYRDSFIKLKDSYSQDNVDREILRILNVLHDNGYPEAHFVREQSSVLHSLRTNNLGLIIAFHQGRQFTFGDIALRVEAKERPDMEDRIMLRFLEYQPGEAYSQRKKLDSERNLNRLGLFEAARIETNIPSEEDTSTSIATAVVVRPKDKHELNPEIAILEENNAFNIGLGIGYTNLNFFGEARRFITALRFRVQEIGNVNLIRVFGRTGLNDPTVVGRAELSIQLTQPYVFSRKLSGLWNFSLIADKQKPFVLTTIRNRIGFGYEFNRTTSGFVDWNLERIELDAIEDTSQTRIIRERPEEERPQFNSVVSFTLQRDRTDDIFSPSHGYSWTVSVEEAGVLPAIAEQLGSKIPFSQFYKLTLFGRYFADLTRDRYTILAAKAKFGFVKKYFIRSTSEAENRDLPVPLNRRFFAGGSGSLRGWRTRELGAVADPQLGGNALFELSVETRTNFTRGLGRLWVIEFDNIWAVLFADIGNVWPDIKKVRLSEVAVTAGFGFRYDAIFGPFRVDLGFQLYDPRGREWIYQRKFWKDATTLHFGIGHAF
ncbi:MAG: outer membrane protein assembly factor, partial [Bacteroidota bacterium]